MNYKIRQLKIKKRSTPEWLTLSIFIMPFCLSFLMEFLQFPDFIKYYIDFAWVVLFLVLFVGKQVFIRKNLMPMIALVGVWLLYVLLIYIFNFQSIFYFLWGIRNNFRFYIAFFAFATLLSEDDISSTFKLVDILFWINAVVALFQFFVLGYQQDYLGGIFGVERGCNAYSTVLFAVVITRSLLQYLSGQEKMRLCFLKCGVALAISAMAEVKFFFVLFVIILVVSMLLTEFSWKKLFAFLIMAILMMFSSNILTTVFGAKEELTFQRIFDLATSSNYATAEDLGRFTAIPTISKSIFKDVWDRLFGMGLGNCDTSAFAICNTPFYQSHGHLHYSWFSSAFLFLETGYIGLTLNLTFYIAVLVLSIYRWKRNEGNILYCQMATVFAIICIILTFYNSALRKEVGYIAYFVLALPFVLKNSDVSDEERNFGQ